MSKFADFMSKLILKKANPKDLADLYQSVGRVNILKKDLDDKLEKIDKEIIPGSEKIFDGGITVGGIFDSITDRQLRASIRKYLIDNELNG